MTSTQRLDGGRTQPPRGRTLTRGGRGPIKYEKAQGYLNRGRRQGLRSPGEGSRSSSEAAKGLTTPVTSYVVRKGIGILTSGQPNVASLGACLHSGVPAYLLVNVGTR
jgi:hypothetical protein